MATVITRFHITHTTVQIEVEGCEANDMYCGGRARKNEFGAVYWRDARGPFEVEQEPANPREFLEGLTCRFEQSSSA
jgi:hypothetical protein